MINTVEDLKRACNVKVSSWFEPENTRFFKSKYGNKIYKEKYFITSEQFKEETRLYSIRVFKIEDGKVDINTVGEFQGFESRKEAEKHIEDNL